MMALSSFQRIKNDISIYEEDSDHKVKPEKYYVIKIESLQEDVDMSDFAKKDLMAKYIMGETIMCAYVYYNAVYLLFSSTDEKPHYLNGSHHALCSHYSSNASLYTKSHIKCSIVEFDTRTKVLIFFQTKVFENMKESIRYLSNVKIDKKEIATLTQSELIELLNKRASVKWNSATTGERFGTFYKFHMDENGSKKFSVMSELFDVQHMEKYNSYIFG